jgi:hypothetical protein
MVSITGYCLQTFAWSQITIRLTTVFGNIVSTIAEGGAGIIF